MEFRVFSYDEETNEWTLPALTVERTVLPLSVSANSATTPPDNHTFHLGRSRPAGTSGTRVGVTGIRDPEIEKEEEARLYAKLASRSQNHTKYFANKRMEQLLLDAGVLLYHSSLIFPFEDPLLIRFFHLIRTFKIWLYQNTLSESICQRNM